MRVLFVSPSAKFGGAERALLEGCRALRLEAPEVHLGLITLEDGPLIAEARGLEVDAWALPAPARFGATGESGRRALGTWVRLATSGGSALKYSRRLRDAIRRWQPDIVHSNGMKTHVLSAWATAGRTPLVWHVHDYVSSRRVSAPLLRAHRRRASLIVANSESVAADVAGALGTAVPIAVVYNAVDTNRFAPEGPRLDLDECAQLPPAVPGTLRVGLVATFARWKGHGVFLEAMARLASRAAVRGYIIGGPVYRTGHSSQTTLEELRARIETLGLTGRIGFTGFLSDPSAAFRSLDVVVHASIEPEPFGLSIAEGLACGRAVVMSDAGGAREVGIPERTCLAFPPGDSSGAASQIARLLDDADLRRRLGAAAIEDVRARFSHRQMGRALVAAYDRARGAHVAHAGA
jgi:glycosyltransferase involved in cell wall biosynthesis